jgi:hypothetical protein
MLRLCGALPIRKVRVDFLLVREVKCESSVHLLERQCRIALDHAFRRHTLAEEIHQRIQGYASVRDMVRTFAEVTYSFGIWFYGAPGMIRTCDLLVRSQTLYPTELRARDDHYSKR